MMSTSYKFTCGRSIFYSNTISVITNFNIYVHILSSPVANYRKPSKMLEESIFIIISYDRKWNNNYDIREISESDDNSDERTVVLLK